MSDLLGLMQSVYTITNRPDLVDATQLAILKNTLKEHNAIDYKRDLVSSAVIPLDNTAGNYRYTIGISSNLSRLRKIKTITEVVPGNSQPALYSNDSYCGTLVFTEADPSNLFDNYLTEMYNYWTRTGDSLNLVAVREVDNIGILYYQQPNVTPTGYQSWIADNYPYVIYEAAAVDIFNAIGKDTTEAKIYRSNIVTNRMDIIRTEVNSMG